MNEVVFAALPSPVGLPGVLYIAAIALPANTESGYLAINDTYISDETLFDEELVDNWGQSNTKDTHRVNWSAETFSTPEEAIAFAKREFNRIFD